MIPGWAPNPRYEDPAFRAVFARLVTHYWSHGCFLADDQIQSQMDRLVVVDDAGHGGGSFTSHLVTAIDSFAGRSC